MAQTAGRWGVWGIYEPPEGRATLEFWEQYLKELQGVEFAKGAVPTKQDMIAEARRMIAELKAKA
jgi:hypothetical protein